MGKENEKRERIDMDAVAKSALNGASDSDIADSLEVSEKYLIRHCRKLLRRVRASRRVHLHRAQFATAMKGNATLLTFLGKHELGQNDSKENMAEPVKAYVGIEVEKV